MKPSRAAEIYARRGLRVFPVHLDKSPATAHGVKDATNNIEVLNAWRGLFDSGGVAIACGGPARLLVVDIDRKKGLDGSESLSDYGTLPPGPRVQTPSGGEHVYLRVSVGDAAAMRNAVGLLPGVDVRWDNGYVVAPTTPKYVWLTDYDDLLSDGDVTIPLAPSWLIELIRRGKSVKEANGDGDGVIAEGERNASLASIAGAMRRRGIDVPVILEALRVINRERCRPPLPDSEVEAIARSIGRYDPAVPKGQQEQEKVKGESKSDWPRMDRRAFYGPIGECVQRIAPHSEADPNALLLTALACFGSACGRGPYYQVEGDRHYPNIYICLVGDTAKGRKGTSWSRMRGIIEECDPSWRARIASGLSSGEGLIYAVRDPLEGVVTDKKTKVRNTVILDEGVRDKRLMCYVPEFGGLLKIARREGNTLSATMRCAWDSGVLRVLTKNSPLLATGAHVSVVAHVTRQELIKNLDEVEVANGLGNRFLWVVVKRSQFLPLSAGTPSLEDLLSKISAGVKFAWSYPVEIRMTSDAEELWTEMYPALSEGRHGLAGALTARSEAQTVRLALIYALADKSMVITRDHLTAALCVVDFCRRSVVNIWGHSLGDTNADFVFETIKASNGLTTSDLYAATSRNMRGHELQKALSLLKAVGMIESVVVKKNRGRPATLWTAVPAGAQLRGVVPP